MGTEDSSFGPTRKIHRVQPAGATSYDQWLDDLGTTVMTTHTVSLDSIDYHVVCEGPQDGRLVVLLHALMSNLHIWDSTVKALHNAGFKTLRFDHVGHGLTKAPREFRSYHFDDFTRHIRDIVLAVLPNDSIYAIVGCSMGGVLSLRYVMLYPGTVKKIASCESPGMTSLEASKPKWRQRISQFRAEGVENLAKVTTDRWFPDPCDPQIRVRATEICKTCTLPGYEICAEGIMNYDYTHQLGQIDNVDVMVMMGENDEAVGRKEVLVEVANKIKGARFVEMEATGHIPPMHRSQEFEKILLDFLNE